MAGKGIKGILLGAAFIGLGILSGGAQLLGIGLKGIFLTVGGNLALNSLVGLSVRTKQGTILQGVMGTLAPLPVVYGETKLGIAYVDRQSAGDDNKDYYIVGALCHGSEDGTGIAGIDEIYFDDRLAFDSAGNIQTAFVKDGDAMATVTKYLGTDAQSVDATLNSLFPTAWPSTSKLRGVAYIVVKLVYDPEIYATGEPVITAIVRGNKVKDPSNLASAAAYSTNPARCIYDHLTSLRYGLGATAAEVDAAGSFSTFATYYGTQVERDTADVADYPIFECNGWLDVGQSVKENLNQLLTSCRGVLIYEAGKYRIHTRRVVTPTTFALTEANIVGDFDFTIPGIGDAPNIVHGIYVEPGSEADSYPHQAATRVWPRPGEANGYLTEDNDYEVMHEMNLPFTNNVYTAEQIILVTLKEARAGKVVTLTATEAALTLQVGDLVPVTHPFAGWVAKNFWVMAVYLLPETGHVRLSLLEYDADAYDLDALDTVPTPPDTNLPNPFTVAAPTDLILLAGDDQARPDRDGTVKPYIKASWTATPHPFLDYYEIQYRKAGEADWLPAPDPNREDLVSEFGPVTEGQGYDVQVRAVNTIGKTSDWVESSVSPQLTVKRQASEWVDDFGGRIDRRWVQLDGVGAFESVHDPDSGVGGSVGRAIGPVWMEYKDHIPFDPNMLYVMHYRVRQLRDPGSGDKEFFLGLAGTAQLPGQPDVFVYVNRVGVDRKSTQHYVLSDGGSLAATREWTDYYAYVKGYAGGTVELTSDMLTNSGLDDFSADNCVDGDTDPTQVAFSTDTATAGAYLLFDLGEEKVITDYRLHYSAEGSEAEWDLEFADDAAGPWTRVDM